MNSGREKWPLGALAIAILLGIAGIAAVFGGLTLYSMSGSEQSQQASAPATSDVASTTVAATQPTATAPIAPTTPSVAPVPEQQQAQAMPPPPPPPAPEAATVTETVKQAVGQAVEKVTDQVAAMAIDTNTDYQRARWHPIHFKPAIDQASDADCLKCHQEVLDTNTRETSPAGLKKADSLAWYQTLDTYESDQLTFHQRHMTAPFIKKVANMSCTTCHQGNDPREETGTSATDLQSGLTLRKMVDPNVCLMCHGQFPYQNMGLPGPWHESGATFQNNCLLCHAGIRTTRHNVNFLNAAAIETEGAANSDTCYGCHGGRAWYRVSFPYPRHAWPGSGAAPDWAKDRPTESDLRFLIQGAPAKN